MKMSLLSILCLYWALGSLLCLLIYCSDYSGVSKAYEAMKNVASLINERKRRLESIDTIAHWQVAILHWEVMMNTEYKIIFYFILVMNFRQSFSGMWRMLFHYV